MLLLSAAVYFLHACSHVHTNIQVCTAHRHEEWRIQRKKISAIFNSVNTVRCWSFLSAPTYIILSVIRLCLYRKCCYGMPMIISSVCLNGCRNECFYMFASHIHRYIYTVFLLMVPSPLNVDVACIHTFHFSLQSSTHSNLCARVCVRQLNGLFSVDLSRQMFQWK